MEKHIIENFLKKHTHIFVIVSPPRCSSTALVRVFWEHPLISHYAHEPFEALYYWNQRLDEVFDRIKNPLDLRPLKRNPNNGVGNGIVIKEMPYQVGPHFELLANLATAPIVFIIRDPRLNISSRMKMKMEVGDSPIFPHIESGWKLLESQIAFCQAAELPHLIVDSREFRNRPNVILKELFNRMHLSYSNDLLLWKSHTAIDIDNLDGKHSHLYKQVLQSDGLLPDDGLIPSLESFSDLDGFYPHVIECLEIYQRLRKLPQLVAQRGT
jgi:hypothetical protein